MSDIENCQSITLMGYLKSATTTSFNYDPRQYNNEIKFIPDVCIIRTVNFMATDNNTQGYRYGSGLLLWSNLTNNYIATINPVWNPSNIGTIQVTCNYTSNPQSVIRFKGPIPNILQFQVYSSAISATDPFSNNLIQFTANNVWIQLTIDFIQYKKTKK